MILWLAGQPTPQFTPVLNRLYGEAGLPIFAYYICSDSVGGRGWGVMKLAHPHAYHQGRGCLRDFCSGYSMAGKRGLQAAVVFGYSTPVAMGLLLGCRARRIPIFTQSDSDYRQQRRKPLPRRLLKGVALRVLYPRSTRVWVIGESNARYWSSHGLRNQEYVPFESPIPVASSDEAPNSVSGNRRAPALVLYVGRLSPEKRVEDALLAIDLLREEGMNVELRLVGTGDLPQAGHSPNRNRDWVQVRGAVPHNELARQYIDADVLVLPSEVEAYGLVVREALQFGVPVVASTVVPAARELCNFEWNLVPPRSPATLAAALKRAIELPDRWPARPAVDTVVLYREELRRVVQQRPVTE